MTHEDIFSVSPRHRHTGIDSEQVKFSDLSDISDTRVSFNPPNIISGSAITSDFSVLGARFGDFVIVSHGADLQGVQATGYVSGAGTVTLALYNGSAQAVDLEASTAWIIRLIKV